MSGNGTTNGMPDLLNLSDDVSMSELNNENINSENTGNNGITQMDRRSMLAMLKVIRKFNLTSTVDALCRETNIPIDESDIDIDEHEMKIIGAKIFGIKSSEQQPQNAILGGQTFSHDSNGSDPIIYETAFRELRNFVDDALDIYKHELSLVLYPILMQIYLKLVFDGHTECGRKIVESFAYSLEHYHREDLRKLLLIISREDMLDNDLVKAIETERFIIRMSRDSHSLFKRHIQDRRQEVIADISSKYLHFETYEGTARSKAQCAATSGSIIGEAKRQDNKVRVYYGLLKEFDFQSLATPAPAAEDEDENDADGGDKPKRKKPKKDPLFSKKTKSDPNAPANDRIPLPEMKDTDKWEKIKAMREASKRINLGKDCLPSICIYTITNTQNTVTCAEVSEDSTMLAVGFSNAVIKVWSLTPTKLRGMKTSEQLREIDKDAEDVFVRMMDDRTGDAERVFNGHYGPIYRASFSPEKNLLISCSEDTTIRLWSLHTWSCIVVYKGHTYPVWDVRFSPHGYYFASCSYDRTARLWVTDSHQPVRLFTGHLSDVDCVLFHPNSNYIATGSDDRTVRLWDVLNGQMVRLMTGHKGSICALAFSVCGRYLASSAADYNILIWDISTGQLVNALDRHAGSIYTLAFSREGTILTAGGLDNLVTIWDFSKLTEDYLAQNSNAHNPDLNDSELYLLRAFETKSTPLLSLHFTRRNVMLAVGTFQS